MSARKRLASVAGQARLNYLTADHLVSEATSWGLDSREARAAIETILQSAIDADVSPAEEIAALPALVAARAGDLLAGRTARHA